MGNMCASPAPGPGAFTTVDADRTKENRTSLPGASAVALNSVEGHTYLGQVKDWQPHGTGKMTRKIGSSGDQIMYTGVFECGERHGRGTVTEMKAGAVSEEYEGQFEHNKLSGMVKKTWPEGRSYEGMQKHRICGGHLSCLK